MERDLLVVMAISDGSCLTVLAASACDVGVVAYEMTVLVTRAGDVLTPSLRAELQAALPPSAPNIPGGRQESLVVERLAPVQEANSSRAGQA